MYKLLYILIAVGTLVTPSAHAQFDHLTCFKAKDSIKFDALATLDAAQNAFDPGQCTIIGKARLFCVPTHKQVTQFTIDNQPGNLLPVPGIDPQQDHVCYKVKCPAATIADTVVSDQFGARTLSNFKTQFLCVPAVKGVVTTTTTTTIPPLCPTGAGAEEACARYQAGGACTNCC